MAYYLFSIFWSYCVIFLSRKFSIAYFVIFSAPLVIFSTFRGTSGPDTISYFYKYIHYSNDISSVFSLDGEPVTYLLMFISNLIYPGEFAFFNFIYSIILVALFYLLCREFDRYKVFLLVVGPVFIIDGLTNTIRVSLAYFIFLYSYASHRVYLLLAISFFSHVSTVIMVLFKNVIENLKSKLKAKDVLLILGIGLTLVISVALYEYLMVYFPRISDKMDAYERFRTKSSLSGISDIYIIASLLIVGSIFNRTKVIQILLDITMIIIFSVALYHLASYSIGILRVFKILIVCIAMAPFLYNSRRKIPALLLLIIGSLYTFNYLRIIYFEEGYLPYGGEF
ncbi:EpsG family protein [Vibrio fluvialis]|nr:EpsG family protein [Vibrio fluvialis]